MENLTDEQAQAKLEIDMTILIKKGMIEMRAVSVNMCDGFLRNNPYAYDYSNALDLSFSVSTGLTFMMAGIGLTGRIVGVERAPALEKLKDRIKDGWKEETGEEF